MKTTVKLLLGELKRLIRYKILPVSLVTALLWFALFLFLSREESFFIAPLLIYVDSTIMVILLVGAFNHLERQDGTISTMMVLPVSIGSILTAKAAASMMLALSSMVVTAAALYFIHNLVFDYAALFLFILLTGAAFCSGRIIGNSLFTDRTVGICHVIAHGSHYNTVLADSCSQLNLLEQMWKIWIHLFPPLFSFVVSNLALLFL
jgi:ABC-type transport system involved in cytochrome c biogenesis permease component